MIGDWINRKLLNKIQVLSKGEYNHTLSDCFEMANSEVYTRSQMMLTNRAYGFFKAENGISLLSEFLRKKADLDRFQYVGCGDNAIVVRYSEHQALRFRAPAIEGRVNTQDVLKAPFISPVWNEVEFLGGRLNFVPFHKSLASEILSGNVKRATGEELIHILMEAAFRNVPPMWFYDYYNYDFKFEQIAILDDWTPLIIDQGGVILETDAPVECSERIASDKDRVLNEGHQVDTPWDGKWVDGAGKPKIDHLEKPPSNILELQSE